MDEKGEKKINDYPRPIFIEEGDRIFNQMKTSICKVYTESGNKGTGFFCKIPYPDKDLKVFITDCNLIDKNYLEKEKVIYVSINNKPKEIKLERKFKYINKFYDVTIVEIKENVDDIKDFLELDENQVIIDYFGSSIYTLQYPIFREIQKPAVSFGILQKRFNIKKNDFIHSCSTERGSSGSPILNLSNFKIIGMQKKEKANGKDNIGVFLNFIIKDFITKYNNRRVQFEAKYTPEKVVAHPKQIHQKEENGPKKPVTTSTTEKVVEVEKVVVTEKDVTQPKLNHPIKENPQKEIVKAEPSSKDEIRIKYKINESKEIRLFGDKFVENNKNICKIIFEKKEEILVSWKEIEDNTYREFLEITLKGLSNVTNISHIFYGCSELISFDDISNLDMKNVTDISYAFYGCASIEEMPDISVWDTSNVTDIESLFSYCQSLRCLPDISKWNTDNITNMSYLFYGCSSLISIPNISKWNTSKITKLNSIFSKCSSITNLPEISNWKTENVVNMSDIFSGCTNLKNIPDLSKWNTKNVTDMQNMFSGCSSIKELPDISNWNTSNVTNMRSMFSYCTSLENLPNLNKWDISKVENKNYMFLSCNKLNNIPSKFS